MGRAAPAARKYETALWFTLIKSISILIDEKQMRVANVEVMTPSHMSVNKTWWM